MWKHVHIMIRSLRSMWRFRLRSVLTLLSAMLGVSGVISSVNYAAGGRQQVLDQIQRMGTNVLIVTPQFSRSVGGRARTGSIVKTLVDADYAAIRRGAPSIIRSSAVVTSAFLLKRDDFSKNAPVVGCEPDYFRIKNWRVVDGETFEESDLRQSARVVLLGHTVARDLFGADSAVGKRLLVNRVPFQVVGVLAERGQGLDIVNEDNEVFIPLTTSRRRLLNIDYYSSIVLEVDRWDHMSDTGQTVNSILRQRHRVSQQVPSDFQVQNQKTLFDTLIDSSEKLTSLVRTIGLTALIVSGLGVFAVSWISVKERTVEIGTIRALGATSFDIFFQILFEAATVSTLGSFAGLVIGWFATSVVTDQVQLPFVFDWLNAYLVLALAALMNLTFSFWPSRKAARLDPISALKYE